MSFSSIPLISMPALSGNYRELNEPFVDIAAFSGGAIDVDMKYFAAKRNGAINIAFVRKTVAEKLIAVSKLLPDGYRLKIYDAWRPYEVQKDLYDEYFSKLSADVKNRGKSSDELHATAKTFVSFPDRSARFAFVHSSGGAVDLTIIDENGNELDMGCGFDDFSDIAATHALENSELFAARDNRRLLYHVMTSVGFTNYPAEWWHYDFGDIFYSALTGESAVYPSEYSYNDILKE